MKKILIVFFVALLFCDEEEKYTFANNTNEGHVVKYNQDDIMTFDIPGFGEARQGGSQTQLLEYLGKQDEFFLIRSTLSNIISINVVGDKVSTDYESQVINNIPCLLYIDVNGEVDHLEAEEDYMEDIFKEKYLDIGMTNYIYPFGKNAVDISIGDSWTEIHDSIIVFLDEGGSESVMSDSAVYTLDKIKLKKGRKIAYISVESYVECKIIMLLMGEFMEGNQAGTFKSSYRFDVDAGEMITDRGSGEMRGEYDLGDLNFKTSTYFSNTYKRAK